MRFRLLVSAALLVPALAGCGADEPVPQPAADIAGDTATSAPAPTRRYERHVTFLASRSDSAPAVVWLLDAASGADGVARTAEALLLRGGAWERFLDESWATPPTRAPWRVLPHGPMRLVVSETEALERLVYSAAPRELEVVLDETLVDWTGRRGETLRLSAGGLLLGGVTLPGYVADLARTAEPGASPGGDWAFLVSGDSLQLILHASSQGPGTGENLFQGWARLDFREWIQPDLSVTWEETRSFERARRTVPARWALADPGGLWDGRLEVVTSWLEAGEGEGPQLPVDAVFEVQGVVTIEGVEYPVRGLFRHTQE